MIFTWCSCAHYASRDVAASGNKQHRNCLFDGGLARSSVAIAFAEEDATATAAMWAATTALATIAALAATSYQARTVSVAEADADAETARKCSRC